MQFCCAREYDKHSTLKKMEKEVLQQEIDLTQTIQNADAAADMLLHRLNVSASTLSPLQAKQSVEMVRTQGWQME